MKSTFRKKMIIAMLFIILLIVIWDSLFIGRYPLSITKVAEIIFNNIFQSGKADTDIQNSVVLDIRFPRALLGALVGASLAASGTALQGLFRNPLVDAGLLGVSSGAGFGAALAIILFHSQVMIYIFSFGFGLLAVFLSYSVGKISKTTPAIMLVLGGVVISTMFSSLLAFLKYVADPYSQLPAITFWMMGSLATASYGDIAISAIPMMIGMIGLLVVRWRLNVLSMGDKEAQVLGLHVSRNKMIIIICTTLATAGAVCVTGMIGWIGLVIPHIGRMLVGNDNAFLMPASMALGGIFLIVIDNIGRVLTGSEIPLSILTAIIGGPFYIYFLKKTKGGGW